MGGLTPGGVVKLAADAQTYGARGHDEGEDDDDNDDDDGYDREEDRCYSLNHLGGIDLMT